MVDNPGDGGDQAGASGGLPTMTVMHRSLWLPGATPRGPSRQRATVSIHSLGRNRTSTPRSGTQEEAECGHGTTPARRATAASYSGPGLRRRLLRNWTT